MSEKTMADVAELKPATERDAIDDALDLLPSFANISVEAAIRVLRSDPLCPSDMAEEQLRALATEMVKRAKEREVEEREAWASINAAIERQGNLCARCKLKLSTKLCALMANGDVRCEWCAKAAEGMS